MTLAEKLRSGIDHLHLELPSTAEKSLLHYLELLQKWNKTYNLTAIREPEQMLTHHLLDSLAVLPHLWPANWLDVGSGAGLPGIVLAVSKPEWSFTLLDSNSKKTSFVQQVVIDLGIRNVKVCCARVEDWRSTERFDGIISRAFAEIAEFVRVTKHLGTREGGWVAMKGIPGQELLNLPLGVYVEKVIPLEVPGIGAARSLVVLRENIKNGENTCSN